MLSLEEQIIDATTEEGQAALKEFEEQERAATKVSLDLMHSLDLQPFIAVYKCLAPG
jgi:hypothetical protein